jgi:DNA-binding NarL/FixJ family response regulator
VLVVDDEPVVLRSLQAVLAGRGAKVTAATSADEAGTIIDQSEPFDAAIVDFDLPDRDGLSIIASLRSGAAPCSALMITGHTDRDYGARAIEAGADDFLIKPFVPDDLIAALTKTVQQTQQWRRRLNGESTVDASALSDLTPRERQIVELVLTGKTNRQIAEVLGLRERTVKYHMAGILGRFDVRSRTELILLLIRN